APRPAGRVLPAPCRAGQARADLRPARRPGADPGRRGHHDARRRAPGRRAATRSGGVTVTEPALWRADDLAATLEPALPGRVEVGAPLAGLTTYRVGGAAAVLVRARREGDLAVVANALSRARPPLLVVGRGSNLLVADAGFPGLVL